MKIFYLPFFFAFFYVLNFSVFAIEKDTMQIEMRDAQISYTEDGKVRYSADFIECNYFDDKIIFRNGAIIKEYDKNFLEALSINTNYAEYIFDNEELYLAKDVKVTQKSNKIFCEDLWFSLKNEIFHSQHRIKIETPDVVLEGFGFESKKDLSQFFIEKVQANAELNF